MRPWPCKLVPTATPAVDGGVDVLVDVGASEHWSFGFVAPVR
jgi:hypothetical protein